MNKDVYLHLHQRLRHNKAVVLVRIIRRQGSAPRGVGSLCMVDADGKSFGSIGGGGLEFKAIEKAKALFNQRVTSRCSVALSAKELSDEGMICGGRVELFLEPILPEDKGAVELFSSLAELLHNGGGGTLMTRVSDGSPALAHEARMLVEKGGGTIGTISGVDFSLPGHAVRARLLATSEKETALFIEPIEQDPELLLFGGGHIAAAVSPIARMTGFQVAVLDDRADFANRERFPDADNIYALPYQESFKRITITETSYIVIVTRGHVGDREVLELVLKSGGSPAYIGMIGSVRKRNTLYAEMIRNGTDEQALSSIHSPIGLDIGAQTPEEIAISIMAEIIRVRADRGKDFPVTEQAGKERFACRHPG